MDNEMKVDIPAEEMAALRQISERNLAVQGSAPLMQLGLDDGVSTAMKETLAWRGLIYACGNGYQLSAFGQTVLDSQPLRDAIPADSEQGACKRCKAYANQVRAQETQLTQHRALADQYREAIATLDSERQVNAILSAPAAGQVTEWHLSADTAKFLAEMILAGDEPAEITLRLGFIKNDDGTIQHGLLVEESECPEEGASLLVECPVSASFADQAGASAIVPPEFSVLPKEPTPTCLQFVSTQRVTALDDNCREYETCLGPAYAQVAYRAIVQFLTANPAQWPPAAPRSLLAQTLKGYNGMVDVLQQSRNALEAANTGPGASIIDTIWMPGRAETLFDFLDAALTRVQVGS